MPVLLILCLLCVSDSKRSSSGSELSEDSRQEDDRGFDQGNVVGSRPHTGTYYIIHILTLGMITHIVRIFTLSMRMHNTFICSLQAAWLVCVDHALELPTSVTSRPLPHLLPPRQPPHPPQEVALSLLDAGIKSIMIFIHVRS